MILAGPIWHLYVKAWRLFFQALSFNPAFFQEAVEQGMNSREPSAISHQQNQEEQTMEAITGYIV